MTDFARWIASTSPIIYVGHCDDRQCFYCDGGEYQNEPDDVIQQEPGRFGGRCWHRPDCLWLVALDEVLPADRHAHCNACGHEKGAHAFYEGECGEPCEVACQAFVPPAGRR